MFHKFLLRDGRMALVNLSLVEMIHQGMAEEFQRPEGQTFIGPSVELWFSDDRLLVVNATLDSIEALLA